MSDERAPAISSTREEWSRTPSEPAKDLPTHLSDWVESDLVGARLAKRSIAADWKLARLIMLFGGLLSGCFLIYVLCRFSSDAALLVVIVFGVPAQLLVKSYKRGLYLRAVGEQTPSDSVVAVRYEMDGFEYGRDLGRLCREQGWLFFEGERSSFSLAANDVVSRWVDPALGPLTLSELGFSGHYELRLAQTRGRVVIRVDPISQQERVFRGELATWVFKAAKPEGVSLFPPLEPNPRGDFSHGQRWGVSYGVAYPALAASYILTAILFGTAANYPLAHVVLGVASVAAGIAIHRVTVRHARDKAFHNLSMVRAILEGREVEVLWK